MRATVSDCLLVFFLLCGGTASATTSLFPSQPVGWTIIAGSTAKLTSTITIYNNGNTGATLTVTPGATWVSGSLSPATIGPAGSGSSVSLTVTADPTSLTQKPDAYKTKVTVSGGGSSTDVDVELDVFLQFPSDTFSFEMVAGVLPTTSSYTEPLTNSTNHSVTLSLSSDSTWLTAKASPNPIPAGATTTITVSLTNAAQSLKGAVGGAQYTGTITIKDTTDGSGVGYASTVLLYVDQALSITPVSMSFTGQFKGPQPANLPGKVSNSSQQTVPFTMSATTTDGHPWLSVLPAANSVPAGGSTGFTVSVNDTGLLPGVYKGTVTASTNSQPQATMPVTLTVAGISVSPDSWTPTLTQGANAENQIQVTASAQVQVQVAAQAPNGWLKLDPPNTSVLAPLSSFGIVVDTASLTKGLSYQGAVTLQCTGCSQVSIQVTVNVAAGVTISASTSSLIFNAYQGRGDPAAQNLTLKTSDGSALQYSVTSAPGWVQVNPSSGAIGASTTLSVSVTAALLSPGGNSGTIVFTPANGSAPVMVNVTAAVLPFSISVAPNPANISVQAGTVQPESLQVSTVDGGNAPITATASGGNWLSVGANGSAPGSLSYTVDATSLAPSATPYTGSITISCSPSSLCSRNSVTVNVTVTPGPPPVNSGLLYFVPVFPCHVIDTRAGQGMIGSFGPPSMAAQQTRSFQIGTGACPGIPSTAKAFSLNVTAITTGYLGYLTIWPSDQQQPNASTLNGPPRGGPISNAAIVPASANGQISVFVTDNTDLAVDVNGYFDSTLGPAAYEFYPLAPCRVADTRPGSGLPIAGAQLAPNVPRDIPMPQSSCLAPISGAKSYSLNVTVIPAEPLLSLALWPTGNPQPAGVSTLSDIAGLKDSIANAAFAHVGANGSITMEAANRTDVILDVNGFFAAPGNPGGLLFRPLAPCRVVGRGASGPNLKGNRESVFNVVASACNIPAGAQAYSFNVTAVPTGYLGYLKIWPTGQAQPDVSTLNSWDGRTLANAAIVPAGTSGFVSVISSDDADVILDINGYFIAPQ